MLDKVGANSNPNNHINKNIDSVAFKEQPTNSFLDNIGLRTKAVLFAIAISTIPVLTIGAILYSFVNQSRRQEIEIAHRNQANQITTNLRNSLREQLRELEDLPNQNLINNRRIKEQQDILNKWQEKNKINSSNNPIVIVDLNGNIIADTQNKLTENQKEENYFQAVLKNKKPFISQPSNSNNQYYLDLAVPVKNSATNETLYIVRSTLPVNYFQNLLVDKTNQNNYYITDASGKIFLSNNKNYLGKKAQELPTEKVLLTQASWQSEPELGNLKWETLLTTDRTIAFAPVNQLLWKLIIATIITTLLTGGIAAILGHRMILRIMNANYTLKKLGRGNLQTRMPLQGTDELTSLGVNINDMAEKLEGLLQQQKHETQQLRSFTNTLISIRQPANIDTLLNTTVTKIRQIFGVDRVAIYCYGLQNDGQILAESLAPGLLNISDEIITSQYVSLEPVDDLKNNQALAINNIYEANFNSERLSLLEQLQVKSKLTVPIFKDSTFFGYLIIHHCNKQHTWQPQEVSFIQQLAQQFGLSLERIRLLEDSQSLRNLAVHLSNSWKEQDIYNLAVQDIRQALNADRTVIYKFDAHWQGVFLAESVVAGFTCAMGVQLVEPCLRDYVDKYSQGKVQATNNIYQAGLSDCYLQQLKTFNVKANLVAPIIVSGKLLGLLIAHQCSHPRNWQKSEIDLFEQFARLVGLALERADYRSTTEQARVKAEHLFQQYQAHLMSMLEQIECAVVTKSQAIHNQAEQIHKIATTTNTRNEIKTVAKSARLAAQAASSANQLVVDMNSRIDVNIENITTLQNTIDETFSKIKNFGDDCQEIASLAILINQIAAQTNLLAVNAGIEAARTSDTRQEFGIVAEEIAALANKCTALSNQIKTVAHRLQHETTEVTTTVESQTRQVTEDTNSLLVAKDSLSEITEKCGQIETNVNSIYGATASQIQASKQVATALKNLSNLDTNEYSHFLDSQNRVIALIKQMKESVQMYQAGENNG